MIDILVSQPATARFVARHLYNFFVADEPQVPAWKDTPPRDVEAVRTLERTFMDSNYEIRPVLRTMFNSDFFKNARFAKVKSPAEVVVGTMRLGKDHKEVKPGILPVTMECTYMGQDLLNPPTVEGWHTGWEWIDSGTLVERINFVADQLGNLGLTGIKLIVDRMSSGTSTCPPRPSWMVVWTCWDRWKSARRPLTRWSTMPEAAASYAEPPNGREASSHKKYPRCSK